ISASGTAQRTVSSVRAMACSSLKAGMTTASLRNTLEGSAPSAAEDIPRSAIPCSLMLRRAVALRDDDPESAQRGAAQGDGSLLNESVCEPYLCQSRASYRSRRFLPRCLTHSQRTND